MASPDPTGIYLHAIKPSTLPISPAAAEGPYLILIFLLTLLCGANSSLYVVYIHLFGGRHGDPFLLQFAVFTSVACNVTLAFYGFICYYYSDFFLLFSSPGLDVNSIDAYVVVFHTLQAVPEAIGQIYFALRIAKLFDPRRIATRVGLGVALMGITTQFVLMTWFGWAFYSIRTKSHLAAAPWVKDILSAWCVLFITLEICMTSTTIARLIVLRRQTTVDAARKVIFKLGVYSLQGQVLLTAYSLTSLWLFRRSETGWYMPFYLLNGALYTLVLLANLIYRHAVGVAMKQAQSSYSTTQGTQGHRAIDFNAVRTFPPTEEQERRLRSSSDATRRIETRESDRVGDSPTWSEHKPLPPIRV